MSRPNVFADGPWDREAERMKIRSLFVAKAAGAKELGASVHELAPGSTGFSRGTCRRKPRPRSRPNRW